MFQVLMKSISSDWIPIGKPHEHKGDAKEHVRWLQASDRRAKQQFEYRVLEVGDER